MDESIPAAGAPNPPGAADLLETVEMATGENPEYSIIWLHGLGADGHDFTPIVPQLGLAQAPPVRFVFPHAPVIPVTLNGGMRMRAWYDIRSLSSSGDRDEQGILAAAAHVRALMARESDRGVPVRRQFLAGFSQGGAVAAYVALRHPERLGGLIILSSYLIADRLSAEVAKANADLPIFIAHGTQDPVVQYAWGEASMQALRALDYPLTWHTYPMPHSVCMEEIADLGHWLRGALA